jgi:hypothetical protein
MDGEAGQLLAALARGAEEKAGWVAALEGVIN